MFGFACTVLCVLLVWFPMGCLQPIATQELFPRLHPRDPERSAVTFLRPLEALMWAIHGCAQRKINAATALK